MAGMDTAIAVPTKRVSKTLIRQDTFFNVTTSEKRLDRIVPIIAVYETVLPTQEVGDSISGKREAVADRAVEER